MNTIFAVCFLTGVGLSVLSISSGARHGHRLHLPKAMRHTRMRRGTSMINIAAATAFSTWFGGGGLLFETLTHWSLPLVVACAVLLGVAGAALINTTIGALARRESPAEILSMTGVIAKTVVPIRPAGGTGEIVFSHSGTRRVAAARTDDGRAIPKGTEVIVTRYERGIAYVMTWDELKEE